MRCVGVIAGLTIVSAGLVRPALAQRAAPRDSACITVVNESGRYPLPGARVLFSAPATGSAPVAFSDSTGRACLATRDSTAFRVDALGFAPVSIALGTAAAPPVRMYPLFGDVPDDDWARAQIMTALSAASRRPELQRDTFAVTVITDVLRRAESAPLPVGISQDSLGTVVLAYVDLLPDGSRTGDVRMRFSGRERIVLGVTTTRCANDCVREFDVAVSWAPRAGAGWAPDQLARMDATGEVARVPLDPSLADVAPGVSATSTRNVALVRGVVRDERGRPIRGIEVYSADGSASTLTNDVGAYQLAVAMPPSGALLTTRRIGWGPQFHTVTEQDGRAVTWNPVLRSTTLLAKQLVIGTGVPDLLRSLKYEGFLARRARGVGQFFMTEEIWSAVSLGDVLNRAQGFHAYYKFGNRLREIRVPSCGFNQSVAVFVDGTHETGIQEFKINDPSLNEAQQNENQNTAVNVLARYVNSAIVGMELYRGIENPPEFADPRFCAVIVLWTR
jgi:hypothetical protein